MASTPSEPAPDPQGLVTRALPIVGEKTAPRSEPTELPLRRQVLSDGTVCPLPIRYFDALYLAATFLSDLDRAAALLVGTGLRPFRQEDGQAVIVLFYGEYRKTDIGPYNEVGLSILSVAPDDPIPAIYIPNLPVTSTIADRAGCEIWGFNKFVTEIDIRREGKKFMATLRDPDNVTIGTFEGTRGPWVPMPPSDLRTFSMLNGRLLKTQTQVLTPFQVGSGDNFVLKVGPSRHPMATNMRNLALDGKRPILVQHADPAQALLFPGTPL